MTSGKPMSEDEEDKVWADFVRRSVNRLFANLQSTFGDEIVPLEEMLEIAHETAVIVAMEVGMPPLADSVYNFFERAIKEIWIPRLSSKRTKRRRH